MIIANELDSTCGITDEDLTVRFITAVRLADEEKRVKGTPLARYDSKTKRAYLLYPDGSREYIDERKKEEGSPKGIDEYWGKNEEIGNEG